MIKSLNKSDILVTPFEAQKNWDNNNLDPSDLILWTSKSFDSNGEPILLTGGISHIYIDYGDNTFDPLSGLPYPITNSYCDLASQQQSAGYVDYQKGVYNPSIIYPTASFYTASSEFYNPNTNPLNIDGTYMNLIYDANKHLFYNNYNNFTKTFGMESADLSITNRILTNTMDVFTIPQQKFGQKIVPHSVNIIDKSFDKTYHVIDDGNCNLVFSGSVFSTYQIDNLLNSSQQNINLNIYSTNCTGSVDSVYTSLITSSFGASNMFYVKSTDITASISGGVAPYNYYWYIGGDYRTLWNVVGQGSKIYLNYNNGRAGTDVYYANTYVVCQVIDANNTDVFSNGIYLNYCIFPPPPAPPIIPPTPTTPPINPPFTPADAPDTNILLHLSNTGQVTSSQNGFIVDSNYRLQSWTPDSRIASSILGLPTDVTPFSSSFIGKRSSLWVKPSNVANWITAMSSAKSGYGQQYAGNFSYRIYFDLVTPNNIPIPNPSTFSLSGSWCIDNTGSISLNGVDTNINLTDKVTAFNFGQKHQFNITGGFVSGRNYLDFDIYNYWGETPFLAGDDPFGLYVEYDANNLLMLNI